MRSRFAAMNARASSARRNSSVFSGSDDARRETSDDRRRRLGQLLLGLGGRVGKENDDRVTRLRRHRLLGDLPSPAAPLPGSSSRSIRPRRGRSPAIARESASRASPPVMRSAVPRMKSASDCRRSSSDAARSASERARRAAASSWRFAARSSSSAACASSAIASDFFARPQTSALRSKREIERCCGAATPRSRRCSGSNRATPPHRRIAVRRSPPRRQQARLRSNPRTLCAPLARCGFASLNIPSCQKRIPASPRAIGEALCASDFAAASRFPSSASSTAVTSGVVTCNARRLAALGLWRTIDDRELGAQRADDREALRARRVPRQDRLHRARRAPARASRCC